MSSTGRFLRRWSGTEGDAGFAHWCPGCREVHTIRVEGPNPHPKWSFDGNFEKPTFAPSIRYFLPKRTKDGVEAPEVTLCHYFVRAGTIEYCGDCRHDLNGKKVPLPVWPYEPGQYGGVED